CVAAVGGAVVAVRRRDPAPRFLFLVVGGLAQLVSPLLTFGDPRFKMPLYPTLAVCAAVGVVWAWERWRRPAPAEPAAGGDPAPVPAAAARGWGARVAGGTGAGPRAGGTPVPAGARRSALAGQDGRVAPGATGRRGGVVADGALLVVLVLDVHRPDVVVGAL